MLYALTASILKGRKDLPNNTDSFDEDRCFIDGRNKIKNCRQEQY